MTVSAVNRRFIGMLVAVAIAYATVLIPVDALGLTSVSGLRGIGLLGAPVAALLGWWLTRRVAGAPWRAVLAIGLGMGVLAAVLGVLEIAYLQMLQSLASESHSEGATATLALVLAVIGLPYATLALPVTIPCGVLWALVVRAMFPDRLAEGAGAPSSLGVRHLIVVLAVVAVGASLGSLAGLSWR